jgi:hypothetical protein
LTTNAIVGDNGLVDANGNNCIHHAAELNQVKFLQQLLFADEYKIENIEQLLLSANENNQFPLDLAIVDKQYAAAIKIVKAGGIANQKWSIKRL